MILSLLSAVLSQASAGCLAITNTTLHTPSGPKQGTVVAVDGRIAAVSEGTEGLSLSGGSATYRGAPCVAVEGAGKQVTSGLFAAPTGIGIVEVDLEPSTHDDDPQTEDQVRASLVAADALNPRSTLIAVQRVEGITYALTVPSGGFVSGLGAAIRLSGQTQSEMLLSKSAVMAASVPTASFADGLRELSELIADVRAHAKSPSAYDSGRPYFEGASRLDLEALRPVAEGKLPLLVSADRASDIEALIRKSKELGIKVIIAGAAEGWLVAGALAEAKIPVLVDPLQYGPGSFDSVYSREDNAALLAKAGVTLVLTTNSSHNARTLRQVAGNAVRGGLPHADAIRAITEAPASMLGLSDRGRIAPGAAADLVLWSGDPLELSSRCERMWIDGVETRLESRQSELFERYRRLPGTPNAPLPVQ